MNIVVVAAGGPEVLCRRSGGEKERAASEGVVQVVAWHNHVVDQARRCWAAAIADGEGGEGGCGRLVHGCCHALSLGFQGEKVWYCIGLVDTRFSNI